MNKRLLVILGVFVGGFGIGYALTWLLVSDPAPADRSAGTPPVASAAGDGAIPTANVPPEGGSGGTVSGTVEVDPEAGDAGATDPGEDGGATEAAEDDAGTEPAVAGEGDAVAGEPAAAEDDGASAGGEADPPETGPWWEVCKGQTCAVDFGRVTGSVSLREGEIEDGAEVVWRDTFAKAKRIGSVPAKAGLKVQLHAVGLQHKLPVAAWITFEDGGKQLSGVMALNIGEKVIKMAPIAP